LEVTRQKEKEKGRADADARELQTKRGTSGSCLGYRKPPVVGTRDVISRKTLTAEEAPAALV